MPAVMRLNLDGTGLVGIAVATPVQSVYANGELVMVVEGFVTPTGEIPMGLAGPVPMVEGSPDVFVEGKPLCRIGDKAADGMPCLTGSPDVFANDPAPIQ